MTAEFCPRDVNGLAKTGMTRRRAFGLAGASLISLAMPRWARAAEAGTIVVCKATLDADQPYEQQTIATWELEEFDIYPVPAAGCPDACPTDEAEICADRCGDVEVTCGRFTSSFACPACPGESKTSAKGSSSKKTAKKKKSKKVSRG